MSERFQIKHKPAGGFVGIGFEAITLREFCTDPFWKDVLKKDFF